MYRDSTLQRILPIYKLQRKKFVNTIPGVIFTTLYFLPNLWVGPISKSVCPWHVFPAWSNATLQHIVPICKLQRKKFVNTIPGVVFTTLYFLHNLRMVPMSKSVCPWQVFPAWCNVTLQRIVPIYKLQRKKFVNTIPGALLTTLYFLHNLWMGRIS